MAYLELGLFIVRFATDLLPGSAGFEATAFGRKELQVLDAQVSTRGM